MENFVVHKLTGHCFYLHNRKFNNKKNKAKVVIVSVCTTENSTKKKMKQKEEIAEDFYQRLTEMT